MQRCHVRPGVPMHSVCHDCGHQVVSHMFPTGLCTECIEMQLARFELFEAMHTRIDRLTTAVQFLTERLDNAHLDRLDVICSSWPKRLRTVHDGDEVWLGEEP